MKNIGYHFLLFLILATNPSAEAVLVEENFDGYGTSVVSIDGLNGGTGFLDAYTSGGAGTQYPLYQPGSNIDFGNASSGYVDLGGTTAGDGHILGTATGSFTGQRLNRQVLASPVTDGTIWASFVTEFDPGATDARIFFSLTPGGETSPRFGGQDDDLLALLDSSSLDFSALSDLTKTYLVIARLDISSSGTDTITTWLFADDGSYSTLTPANLDLQAMGTVSDTGEVSGFRYMGIVVGDLVRVDQLRISHGESVTDGFQELLTGTGAPPASGIPMGPGIVDITAAPYNADPSGVADATAAIQQAILDNRYLGPNSKIIYFPNGTYRITGNIVAESVDNANFEVRLQGQSRDGVVLKLDDNHPSYQSGRVPVLTFFAGNGTNNAFMTCIENLTIDVGTGNPAAAALEFHSNNCGFIRDVTLRSSDPSGAGHTGLRLTKANGGMGLIKNLRIEGFDTGIKTVYAHAGYVYEHVELIGQNVIGWDADDKPGYIRDLYSDNTVKVLDTSTWSSSTGPGQIVLVDSTFDGGAGGVWPVEHNYGFLFARNLAVSTSYPGAIQDDVASNLVPGTVSGGYRVVDEYSSHGSAQAFGDTEPGSLNLPVEETPEVPYDDASDWAVVSPNGINDTANIQAALNSGKTTVYFEPGEYFVDTTLTIGPDVRAIRGQWAEINALFSLRYSTDPVFQINTSNHPAVLIERLTSPFGIHDCHMIQNNLDGADLVLRDLFWVMGPVYRGTSNGRLFIENVHALAGGHSERAIPAFIFDSVEVWARQINPEAFIPQFEIRNSQVWILGFKTGEGYGQPFDIADNSVVEILGGIVNRTGSEIVPNDMPVIRSVDSAVTAVMVERAELPDSGSTRYRHTSIVEETRGSTTRILTDTDFPKRGGSFTGFAMPLFLGNLIPPLEDPDKDGVVNIVEYALGLDRFTPDADGLPDLNFIELSDDVYPVLDVVRDFAKDDLSYTVLWSDDLVNWFSGPGYTTTVSESGSLLKVRSNFPFDPANPRQFLRLRIDR